MTGGPSPRASLALGLLLVAAVPAFAGLIRGRSGPVCAADGVSLRGAPLVRIEEDGGAPRSFCCIGCAMRWLRIVRRPPLKILVTDETTGRLLDAREATFVRSTVVAQPATKDRLHAFGTRAEADRHADAYRGDIMEGRFHPFFRTP